MCVRMSPLTYEEAACALESLRETGRARVAPDGDRLNPIYDAHPGSEVPAFVPGSDGRLAVVRLSWGFPLEGRAHAVFNTRIETALDQFRGNHGGMWADAIARGRCLVPVRAFYETHATETVESERTGNPVRRPYRFRLPGARAFLLAGVQRAGCLSIVTTEPNASVSPVHDRMPLVLGPGESSIWLGDGFAALADRTAIALDAEPER